MEEDYTNIKNIFMLTLLNKYFRDKIKTHCISGLSIQILEDVNDFAEEGNTYQFDSIYKVKHNEEHDVLKVTLDISKNMELKEENDEAVIACYSFLLHLNTIDDLLVDMTDFERFVDKIAGVIESKCGNEQTLISRL